MFSIPTLPKILLLIVVVGVVWWWYRRAQVKSREPDERIDRNARTSGRPAKPGKAAKPVEDMAQCRVCNAYVAAQGATRCGRDNCPF
jgi:hypothetical protein